MQNTLWVPSSGTSLGLGILEPIPWWKKGIGLELWFADLESQVTFLHLAVGWGLLCRGCGLPLDGGSCEVTPGRSTWCVCKN